MSDSINYLNIFLGVGAIGLQVVSLITLLTLFFRSKKNEKNAYLEFIDQNFLIIGFFLSLVPMIFSLFYSEVLNYAPCFHCWVQRVFLFPQTFLFGVAWMRKDRNVIWYSLPLLLAGLVDALYLNYIYYFNPNGAPCDATGVSCVQQLVSVFGGYISIPMLALTGFVSLLTLLAVPYFYKRK